MTRPLRALLLALLAATLLLTTAPAQQGRDAAQEGTGTVARETATPFLWRVERGTATGYLYGTIHLPDARALAVPAAVARAFGESAAFYAEIETTPKTEMAVQMAALLPAGKALDRMVGDATWARIRARLSAAGLPPAFAEGMKRMKPWALGATLPMLRYLPDMAAGKPPLDKLLFQRAAEAGKDVGGLETSQEQIAAFEVFSEAEHVRMLRDSLDELDRYEADGRDLMEETLLAWLSGDLERLLALMESGFGQDPELKETAAAALLWRRNLRMAARIEERLQTNRTTFFAVGALHMPDAPLERAPDGSAAPVRPTFAVGTGPATSEGERAPKLGLVTLLRERGFSVTRVR